MINFLVANVRAKNGQPFGWLKPIETVSHWMGLRTIGGCLYIAFAATAALTVICSSIALYTFNTISRTTGEIAGRNLPATVQSFRLSTDASALIALAPRLMAATDQHRRK